MYHGGQSVGCPHLNADFFVLPIQMCFKIATNGYFIEATKELFVMMKRVDDLREYSTAGVRLIHEV